MKKILPFLKWIIALLALSYLLYRVSIFSGWDSFCILLHTFGIFDWILLIFIGILMPVNWSLETWKWKYLLHKSYPISFLHSLKSVLVGLNTGFISPNRIGEFVGRISYLPKNRRTEGAALSLLNSITQNIVILFFGIIGLFLFLSQNRLFATYKQYFWGIIVALFLLGIATKNYNRIFSWIKRKMPSHWYDLFDKQDNNLTNIDLLRIIGISFIRYCVFCLQFFLMLHLLGIHLHYFDALYAIPTIYLIVTISPSFAIVEPAVRGSAAIIVLELYTENSIGIATASIGVWIINFVLPMLIGTFILTRGTSSY